ncbi:MAG TPA: proline dehydrogenase family protein [Candidatus Acidoferrum sp.]|nr:proline dehydrogenase family protein [Candidatus Acidoferrum sp.]
MSELLDRPLRTAILAAADNPIVRRGVTRYGMRLGARRFVAGESIADFLPVAREANRRGFSVAATLLGESIRDAAQARGVTDEYCRLLAAFAQEELDANVAFKLTHVGLDISPGFALENASRIAAQARATNNTVRLDMEQSSYVDATLRIYRALQERYGCAGFVLQSYLYRSESDLRAMLPSAPNVRIVKGAYLEPPSLAFPHKRDVDENYVKLAELALSHDGYTAVATHDAAIVAHIEEFAAVRGLPKRGRFEFQTLYGIAEPLARGLVERGYRVRLSVPYGAFWFPYLMRRLAERPANVGFFLKNAFAPR